ncbi:MAG: hypothetical protein ACJ8R9_26470 [Steroidobacteraceae bacterium]
MSRSTDTTAIFALQTQTWLTRALSVDLSATYISRNADDAHAFIADTWFTIKYPRQAILSLSLNYHLVPNRFVASLELGYAIPARATTRTPILPLTCRRLVAALVRSAPA